MKLTAQVDQSVRRQSVESVLRKRGQGRHEGERLSHFANDRHIGIRVHVDLHKNRGHIAERGLKSASPTPEQNKGSVTRGRFDSTDIDIRSMRWCRLHRHVVHNPDEEYLARSALDSDQAVTF